ncbi:MAG: hypothetical protein U9N01_00260, partial [Euryarchaeota archaeon]|nr:hypothetical protein [Euryarchaeota archaeon]
MGMFQALESIPSEPPPPTGISAALSTIPDVPPMEYRNPAPKKEYSWLQSQYQKFTGKSIEERRAEAAVAVAEHEMAGIPLNETLTDSQRAALYEDRSIKEALDVRIERTKSSSEIAWNRYHAAGNYAVAYGKGDIEAATNSMAAYKAANLQKQELKEVAFREGRGGKIVEGAADLFTQIAALVYGGADEAAQGASLGAMLGGFGAGAGAAPGAAIGAEIGFTYGSLSSAYYSRLGTQTLEKIAKGVDPDIAYRTSVISALVRTVADRVGAGYLVKNIPGVRKLFSDVINTTAKRTEIATLKAFGGESARMVGVETTQEMFDTLMETTDVELAKVLNNKLKGTNLTPTTAGRVAEELKETFDQVFHSMLLVGPFMTMVPYSVDTINAKVDKRNAEAALVKKTEEVIANLTVEEQKVQREAADLDIELEDDYGAQVALDETVPVEPGEDTHVVNEDGNRSPATPVSPIEEQQAMVDPTTTTDEDFDNLVMTPDEDLDVALEEHIAKLNSTGDRYGDFIGTLRRILPRKEAKAMEGFIKARAKATNRTKEQFVEDHGLSMRVAQDVTGKYTGSVEFIGDGETIIRAFQSTTLKDVAHEIGHVFRKDLSETEILQAEKAFGVKDGNWTEQNEEAFADGFVQFIATGEAPTKGLKKLFVKMQKWLGELYRSAKGTNVKVSPEMTEVYKRMFTAQANRDYRHSRAQARNDLKTLFAKKKKSTKTTIREATGQTPTRAGKAVDEHVAFKEGLRKRVQDAKKAASVGKQAGYEKARAKFKAIAERKKNRAALSKSRKKIRKSIQRLIKKSRPKKRQGKPTGMFTADFQDQADVLAEVMVMPVKEAKAIAATMALDEAHTGGSELDVLRNLLILTRANVPTMDEAQLTDLYNRLDTFFKGGRQQRRDELSDRFESIRKAKRMIRTSLRKVRHEEGISLDEREGYAKTKSLFARVKDGIRNKAALDFHGMMEMLDMGTESILGEGFARIWSETLDNERQSNTGRRIAVAKMLNAAAEAYDIRNPDGTLDPKRAKALLEDEFRKGKREITEIELLDKDGMPTGKYETLILDQGQLRKIWMEQMDGDLKESYEAYGFTEQDWLKIRAELSVQDITFIHKQLDLYREYFPRIGEVYERAEGVSFVSSSDFYSPVSRDMQGGTKDGPVMELRQDMKIAKYRSAGNKSLKSRVNTKKKLKIQNDLDVFNYYTRHMEHYIAFAEKVTQLNSVFHDKDVRADIIDTYGEGFYQVLDGMIENISRNGIRPAAEGLGGTLNSFARDIRINVAKGLIGGKVLSIPKQLSSFIGYSEKMPVGMFNTLVMGFFRNSMT